MALVAFLVLAWAAPISGAEILDRVVASIGDAAITQSDVEFEYRLERFLDGQWPPPAPDRSTLKVVCERLVYQRLILAQATPDLARDLRFEKTAAEELNGLRKLFSSPRDYQSALAALHLEENQILSVLSDQQKILMVIEQQWRPAATPAARDVVSYYREVFTPEYLRTHQPPVPPLTEVEGQIQEVLAQKNIDELLADWLEQLGPSRQVHFFGL
jgi:hypothetical protein